MPEIVGRGEELAAIAAYVRREPAGATALVLEGDAGIGKSTLWQHGVEQGRELGLRVLVARPAEAERSLVHVGISDLLEDVLDEALPTLAPPRRRALSVAMLRDETSGDPVDHRAVALAVRDVLRHLGEDRPVLLAVDDVQWLDASSSATLAFALRRLTAGRVLVLLARRLSDVPQPLVLEQALPPGQIERVTVGPLSVGALHRLLRERIGTTFTRRTLLRIDQQSGGNPFFALELARALDSTPTGPGDPLPVPRTLDGLLGVRLAGLPEPTLGALAYAAALGTAPEALLERAGVAPSAMDPAVDAHVVERVDGTVRFTHPLLASFVYRDLGAQRARVHATIARLADDPLVQARHLALSTDLPDADVARVLDGARELAQERGAAAAAAELAEHALRLTPPEDEEAWCRRAVAAARGHHVAGDWTRAQAIAADLLGKEPGGTWRMEGFLLLSELDVDRVAYYLELALQEARTPAEQSAVHARLAWATRFEGGFDHARAAVALAEGLDDRQLLARARAVTTVIEWFAGTAPAPDDLLARTRDLPPSVGGERMVQEATQAVVNTLAPAGFREQARSALLHEYEESRDRDEPRSARALWGLAWVEFWAGRWTQAADLAESAYELAIQYGAEVPQDHLPISVVAIHRGQLDQAAEHSQRAVTLALDQLGFRPPQHVAVLALVSLGRADTARALDLFAEAGGRARSLGWGEPSVRWWTADHVELLLELGRLDDAVALLDAWEADAVRTARVWVLAHATRCRGLVAAARGDVEGAIGLLERALADHDVLGDPFGRARADLALGTLRRRARQKSPARAATASALAGFESLGASGWAERARAELGRIGGRTREEGLTAAEQRVATLVAEGRTNREIADALFLGERTVASHLTHIYAKLGVRSRTELAHQYRTGAPA